MLYETYNSTIQAVTILLNAVPEARYKNPSTETIVQDVKCAFNGTLSVGWMAERDAEKGKLPSRAKDQQSRDCHV